VQTTRLAESFETFSRSVALTRPENFPGKATVIQLFLREPLELT